MRAYTIYLSSLTIFYERKLVINFPKIQTNNFENLLTGTDLFDVRIITTHIKSRKKFFSFMLKLKHRILLMEIWNVIILLSVTWKEWQSKFSTPRCEQHTKAGSKILWQKFVPSTHWKLQHYIQFLHIMTKA